MSGGALKLVAVAGISLAVASGMKHHHHGHGILAGLDSVTVGAASGSHAGCRKLEHLWMAEGGRPSQAQMAASIAMAESGGDAGATGSNTDGSTDRGYWQINSVHGAQSTYDPAANARAAVAISGDGSNWTPWVTYNTGAYAGRC
jgi:hypothetical protein